MHLGAETALDLLNGHLGPDQAIFWKSHLEVCKTCAEDVRQWERLAEGLKRAHLRNATPQDLGRAVNIFPTKPAETKSQLRRVLAALVFDNFLQPSPAGARGAVADARQLVLRAEEFDIHVKIWGDSTRRQLLGQLLSRSGNDFVRHARFHLLRNGERYESATVDELGEFYFGDVPDGNLSLQVDLPNLTVIGSLNAMDGTNSE